jgi:hypothetical protein
MEQIDAKLIASLVPDYAPCTRFSPLDPRVLDLKLKHEAPCMTPQSGGGLLSGVT